MLRADAAGRIETTPHARLHPLSGHRLAGLARLLAPRSRPGEANPRCVVADGALAGATWAGEVAAAGPRSCPRADHREGLSPAFAAALRTFVGELQRGWLPHIFLGILAMEEPSAAQLFWGLMAVAAQLEAFGRQADEEAAGRRRRLLQGQLAGSGGLRRAAGFLRDLGELDEDRC